VDAPSNDEPFNVEPSNVEPLEDEPLNVEPLDGEPSEGKPSDDGNVLASETSQLPTPGDNVGDETEPEPEPDVEDSHKSLDYNEIFPDSFEGGGKDIRSFPVKLPSHIEDGDVNSQDMSGVPPTPQNQSLATPDRRQSVWASDPAVGTPVIALTPTSGRAMVTPTVTFGSPLAHISFTFSPISDSPAKPPAKPSTPIEVFSPATGGSSKSIRSIMVTTSGSSVLEDAHRFSQLSPTTGKVVAGKGRSPVKQSPEPVQPMSSPLGLYGLTMPSSSHRKRPHDEISSDGFSPLFSIPVAGSSAPKRQIRQAASPSVNLATLPSPVFSPFKPQTPSLVPRKEDQPRARVHGMNVNSSAVRRTRQSVLFGEGESPRIGKDTQSPIAALQDDSPTKPPPGYDSLFDDTFSLSPVKVPLQGPVQSESQDKVQPTQTSNHSPAKAISERVIPKDNGSSPVKSTPRRMMSSEEMLPPSQSPKTSPTKARNVRERPEGYDSLFDETYYLSPVKLPTKERIAKKPMLDEFEKLESEKVLSDSLFNETFSLSPVKIPFKKPMLDDQTLNSTRATEIPSSPVTFLPAVSLPSSQSSPVKRRSLSPAHRSSSVQLSPMRLPAEDLLYESMEHQRSPIKQSPKTAIGSGLSNGPDEDSESNEETPRSDEKSRVTANSMDFSPIKASGQMTGEKRRFESSPMRPSSRLFTDDGSPRIAMSSPVSGAGRYGMDIPSSPPIGPANLDSPLDDSFSPLRLNPLNDTALNAASIVRPQNPTPIKARNAPVPISSPPKTLEQQSSDSPEPSSPFENVPPTTPAKSPKRRLSYVDVPLAGVDGPSTPPEKRLKANVEEAPDSLTRRRYGRRASIELAHMAAEPVMGCLRALVRGYLVRKHTEALRKGPSGMTGSGILDSFIRKHEEKTRFAPKSSLPVPKAAATSKVCILSSNEFEILVADPIEQIPRAPKAKAPMEPKAKAPKAKAPKEPKAKAPKEPKAKAPKEPKAKAKEPKVSEIVHLPPADDAPPPFSPFSPLVSGTSAAPPSSPRTRKRSAEDLSGGPAKKQAMEGVRRSGRAAVRPPTISLAPAAPRPTGPLTWETMLERERKELVKKNTNLNCMPTPHKRQIERKPTPRPPSPTAALQTKAAAEGRRKRKAHLLETGIELGPGESPSSGFVPKDLTPPKRGVRWGAPLEYGNSSDAETYSTQVRKAKIDGGRLAKGTVVLDKFGNLEGASPPKAGTSPVVIKKVLYKGEKV